MNYGFRKIMLKKIVLINVCLDIKLYAINLKNVR